MQVGIRCWGLFRELTGREHIIYQMEVAPTLGNLFVRMERDFGPAFVAALRDHNGALRGSVGVMVDGASPFLAQGLQTPLYDGVEVVLMPLMDGGSDKRED
ncbi:MAG: ubiquitin family protein [Chloroflexota bacterium]